MASNRKRDDLLKLLPTLRKPALGCTEIGAIALATAAASEQLSNKLIRVDVVVSPYIYRNVISVGVPKLGRPGVKGIAAGGMIIANTRKKLAILSDLKKSDVAKVNSIVSNNIIHVSVPLNVDHVYVLATIKDIKGNVAEALIKGTHDNIAYVKVNGKIINNSGVDHIQTNIAHWNVDNYSLEDIYQACQSFTAKDINFLKEDIIMNKKIVDYGLKVDPHTSFTKAVDLASQKDGLASWKLEILRNVNAGIDARMTGCHLPVMTSSDSGDHGLTVVIPQYIYAQECKITELKMLQGLAFAHLLCWVIKQRIGSLSTYCGSVIAAATATVAGIMFQRDNDVRAMNRLINMCMVSNGGALCDGAKLSCTYKVLAALMSNFLALNLAEAHGHVNKHEGISGINAFDTIKNIGVLSKSVSGRTTETIIKIINSIKK
ncbi:UPF0597 protein [Bacilli bacterium]|nr:UPF0597 protein [Bacilli bacterium]